LTPRFEDASQVPEFLRDGSDLILKEGGRGPILKDQIKESRFKHPEIFKYENVTLGDVSRIICLFEI
jgi:hypothetical protein